MRVNERPYRKRSIILSRLVRLWFCLVGCTLGLAAESIQQISQYAHTAWRIQDGSFSGTPHTITQTVDGYLWIGTDTRLIRFDGAHFNLQTAPDGAPLYSPSVYSLLGARDGSLWIGNGISIAHMQKGVVTNYNEPLGRVKTILEDQSGKIWLTRSGVRVSVVDQPLCSVTENQASCYKKIGTVSLPLGAPLATNSQGQLWFGTASGLCQLSRSSCIQLPASPAAKDGFEFGRAFAVGRDGSVWAAIYRSGVSQGLWQYRQGNWRKVSLPGRDGATIDPTTFLIDQKNGLWVGTVSHGIYHISEDTIDHYGASDGLSSDSVESLFQDREHSLWVATSSGIDRFRELPVTNFSVRQGLSADHVKSVLASRDGTVWIGDEGALNYLHNGRFGAIRMQDGLPGHNVTSLLEDHMGRLWVGVDDKLTVYDRGLFTTVNKKDGHPLGIVLGMAEDLDQSLWVEVAEEHDHLIHIRDRKVSETVPSPRAFGLLADPGGGVLLGLASGLSRYRNGHLETISISDDIIPRPSASPEFVKNIEVRSLISDPEGTVWGATRYGLLGMRDGKVKLLTSQNGLPCDSLSTLIRDKQGALWLYAKCALLSISHEELERWWQQPKVKVKLRTFDISDGALPGLTSFRPGSSMSRDGRLWFANESILQMIDPAHIEINSVVPPVLVEGVVADQKTYMPINNLRLKPLTRDVEIDYAALSLAAPQKMQFKYKLEGHDRDWQEPIDRRAAFYTDLAPRQYRFRVLASNNDGIWNEEGATLNFSIAPMFYQTVWFGTACAIGILLTLWLLYILRVRQLSDRIRERISERMTERERIARDLHDTFLQGIYALVMRFQTAADQLRSDEPARQMLEEALAQSDQVLSEGREIVLGLRAGATDTTNLSNSLSIAGEELLKFHPAHFRVVEKGEPRELNPLVRNELYRIGKEALNNAFRHANAAEIEVEITYESAQLRVRFRDDGQGIDPAILVNGRRGGHWGLPGMHERATRISAHLDIWSKPGAGTEVDLLIPAAVAYRSKIGPTWFPWFRASSKHTDI